LNCVIEGRITFIARPGLNIQIANRAGLLPRLKLVEQNHRSLHGVEERVAFARTHFGAQA
jgi:hypothetical protein